MKIKLHIPTEQFGYCEVEPDSTDPQEIAETYLQYSKAFQSKPYNAITEKEMNAFVDKMLLGESNHIEMYEKMSPIQKDTIQVVKRALARLKNRDMKRNM